MPPEGTAVPSLIATVTRRPLVRGAPTVSRIRPTRRSDLPAIVKFCVHPVGAVKLRIPAMTGMFEDHSSAPTWPSAGTVERRTSAMYLVSRAASVIGEEEIGAGAPPPLATWPWKTNVGVALLTASGLK